MQNNPSENYMNQKESRLVPNPEQLEDSISKNKTISKASEINVDILSTEQEIKNRRIVKIVGPKSIEDQKEKKLFVFNNTNKDLVNPANPNTTNLFANPFLGSNKEKNDKPTLTHGLFGNLPQNNKNSTENIKKPEEDNKLGLFSGKQNTFEPIKNPFLSNTTVGTGGSLFKNTSATSNAGGFGGLFQPTNTYNSLFGNQTTAPLFNFNTNKNEGKGFNSSDEDNSDYENPETEIEIQQKSDAHKNDIKVEVNEKIVKIPISEFFVYDFNLKKYNSIGNGEFTIEFAKSDVNKTTPLFIFRNSVLKILFQGYFRSNITKLETVNRNFKTITVIQKILCVDENTKKINSKSIKLVHCNESDSKKLFEKFSEIEKDLLKSVASLNKAFAVNEKNTEISGLSAIEHQNEKSNSQNINEITQLNANENKSDNTMEVDEGKMQMLKEESKKLLLNENKNICQEKVLENNSKKSQNYNNDTKNSNEILNAENKNTGNIREGKLLNEKGETFSEIIPSTKKIDSFKTQRDSEQNKATDSKKSDKVETSILSDKPDMTINLEKSNEEGLKNLNNVDVKSQSVGKITTINIKMVLSNSKSGKN